MNLAVFAILTGEGLWIHGHPQEHPMLQLGLLFGVLLAASFVSRIKGEPKSWG